MGGHRGKGSKGGNGEGRNMGKRGRHDGAFEKETLLVVDALMRQLLALPDDVQEACAQCFSYSFSAESPAPPVPPLPDGARQNTTFCTIEVDSFVAARDLLSQGWSQVAVLNMANEWNCGGAWCHKRGSQEEDLFRCSSLPLSLWPRRRGDDMRMSEFSAVLSRQTSIYPFSPAAVVYSPHVLVCRGRDGKTLQDSFVVSVLSSAAQDLRRYGPFNRRLNLEKMRSMLWAAVFHGHRSLVLGAWGCGAFLHEPEVIAYMFGKLLGVGGEFEGRFSIVLFAIIKSSDNLRAFAAQFPQLKRVPACTSDVTARFASHSAAASNVSVEERVALKMGKKVREIIALEKQQKGGSALDSNQLQKLACKEHFVSEFLTAMLSLPPQSDIVAKLQDLVLETATSDA